MTTNYTEFETIEYEPSVDPEVMTYAQRLAMQIEQADAKVTINRVSQPFNWQSVAIR